MAPSNDPGSSSVGPSQGLRRNYLSTLENVAQAVGTMGPTATLGTTIPLLIGKSGNGSWLLFVAILVVFVLITHSITLFAREHVSAGSLGTYAALGLGRIPGVMAGWSYLIAMLFVVISSAVSSAYYGTLIAAHFTGKPVGMAGSIALSAAVAALAWWPSYRDIKFSTKLMLAVEAVSVAMIVLILGTALVRTGHLVDQAQVHLVGVDVSHVRLGFVLAFMLLAGFESVTTLGEEACAAKTTIPRVMMTCLVPIGLLFLLSIYGLTALSHFRNLALDQTDAPFDLIAQSIGLPSLGWMSSVGVALSCYGCALGAFNAGGRVVFSMARAGTFWPGFAAIHPRNATPHRALALLGVLALVVPAVMLRCGIAMNDAMDYLMQIASFGFIGSYSALCLSAPVYLAKKGILTPVTIGVSVVTLTAISGALFLTLYPIPDAPWRYLPIVFVGLLALGVGVTVSRPAQGGSPVRQSGSPGTAGCASPTAGTPADRCPTSPPA